MNLREVITGSRPTASENLIDASKATEVSYGGGGTGRYRSVSLDVAAILLAVFFGFSYYRYLTKGFSVWIFLAAFTLFAVVSVLQAFLSKKTGRTLAIILIETAGIVGFFWQDNWQILAITACVVLAFLSWGYLSARQRLANSIRIPFFGVSGAELGKFTTGLLIFMILIYVPQIDGNPLLVSQKGFGSFFDWASGFVNNFYPNLSLTGTFGSFSDSFTKMELQNNPSFQNLSDAQKTSAIAQQSQQFEAYFLKNASSTVATSSPASDAFYNVLQGMMNAWQSESGGWFLVGWAAVIFIGLRSVGVVFIWFAELISLFFYELLLATGFMKISEEGHMRELIGY